MNSFDDSDMKIAGRPEKPDDNASVIAYERQKSCGNLARAQRLGATLADVIDRLDLNAPTEPEDENIAAHKQMLMIFSMAAAMEEGLNEPLLVRAALNVFYDTLKKERPELYDRMSSSGAYTFYYLEYRRCGNTGVNIGNSFAMLCGREGDRRLANVGKELFKAYYSLVGTMISGMNFVK